MNIHGKEYTEVKDRIKMFLEKFPSGMIQTTVDWHNEDFSKLTVKAFIYPDKADPIYFFTGLAFEERTEKSTEVNSSSWVENCETSAIGRALANMDIGVATQRPSAEEMKKVERMKPEPKPTPQNGGADDSELRAKIMKSILKAADTKELERISDKMWAARAGAELTEDGYKKCKAELDIKRRQLSGELVP